MAIPRRSPSSTGVCTRAERQPGDLPAVPRADRALRLRPPGRLADALQARRAAPRRRPCRLRRPRAARSTQPSRLGNHAVDHRVA